MDSIFEGTYKNKEGTFEKPVPRIFRVIVIPTIQKQWPLVAGYSHLATVQLFLSSTLGRGPVPGKHESSQSMISEGWPKCLII